MYEASVASADSNKNRALESGTAMVPPPAALLKPTASEGGKPGPSDFVLKLRDGKIPLPEPDWAALAKAGVSDANEVLDVFAPGVPEASKTAPTSDLAERARFFNKVGQWESAKAAMAESLEYGGLEGESELKKKLESAEYLDLAEQLGKAAGDLSIDSIAKFSSVVVKTRGGTQVPLSQILPYDNFVRFRTAHGVFPSPKGAVTSAAMNIAGLAVRDAAKEAAARVARPFVGAERAIDEQGPARMVLGQRLIDQVLGGREKAFWLGTDDDLTPKHAVPAPAANIAGKVVSWDTQDPIEKHMLGLYGTSASKEFIAASVDAQTKLQERLKKSAKAKGVLQNYPKKDQVNALFGTFSTEAEANRVVPAKRQTSYLMRYRMMRQAEVPLREFIRARGMLENDELYS
jgi:hypothetical protein